MREGPSCRKPHAASMGSSGTASIIICLLLTNVIKARPPGLRPIFSRISADDYLALGRGFYDRHLRLPLRLTVKRCKSKYNFCSKGWQDTHLCTTHLQRMAQNLLLIS